MNYIQKIKNALDKELNMGEEYKGLLDVYALLVFIKGQFCSNKDVHDAWSVWQNNIDEKHRSLKPFGNLTKEVQDLDTEYRDAIRKVAVLKSINSL